MKTHKLNCKKCNIAYSLKISDTNYNKGIYKKFCSRQCANSRQWTEDDKLKKSNSAKVSVKVNSSNTNDVRILRALTTRKIKALKEGKKFDFSKEINGVRKFYNGICIRCEKEIFSNNSGTRRYHQKCWQQCSGGYRINSTKLHKCEYKGFKMDSGAEKVFAILLDKNEIKWTKNTTHFFEYYDTNNKKRKYFPDFYLPELKWWIEIKGKFYAEKDQFLEYKLKAVENINLIYSTELKNEKEIINKIRNRNNVDHFKKNSKQKK